MSMFLFLIYCLSLAPVVPEVFAFPVQPFRPVSNPAIGDDSAGERKIPKTDGSSLPSTNLE